MTVSQKIIKCPICERITNIVQETGKMPWRESGCGWHLGRHLGEFGPCPANGAPGITLLTKLLDEGTLAEQARMELFVEQVRVCLDQIKKGEEEEEEEAKWPSSTLP